MMDEKQKLRWGKFWRVGKFWYAVLNALLFSILLYIFSGLLVYFRDKFGVGKEVGFFNSSFTWVSFMLAFVLWFIFSFYTWNRAEKEYLKTLNE